MDPGAYFGMGKQERSLDKQPLPEANAAPIPMVLQHENIRGPDYYLTE